MFIRKTILILSVIFAGFYVWFNLEFIVFEGRSLLGLISEQEINQNGIIEAKESANMFPISPDKKAAIKKVEPVPKVAVSSSFLLSIPSLGINAPIIMEPTTNEDRIYKQLEKGVVHYASTPMPGQPGTSIILGHSSVYPWYKGKYGHVFASLSKMQAGDIIQIEHDGDVLSYKVIRSIIFSPDSADDFELRSLEYTEGSSIVLMTCWPTGTNAKRVALKADLIN